MGNAFNEGMHEVSELGRLITRYAITSGDTPNEKRVRADGHQRVRLCRA